MHGAVRAKRTALALSDSSNRIEVVGSSNGTLDLSADFVANGTATGHDSFTINLYYVPNADAEALAS